MHGDSRLRDRRLSIDRRIYRAGPAGCRRRAFARDRFARFQHFARRARRNSAHHLERSLVLRELGVESALAVVLQDKEAGAQSGILSNTSSICWPARLRSLCRGGHDWRRHHVYRRQGAGVARRLPGDADQKIRMVFGLIGSGVIKGVMTDMGFDYRRIDRGSAGNLESAAAAISVLVVVGASALAMMNSVSW